MSVGSGEGDIRRAYHALCRKHRPDKATDPHILEEIKRINEASSVLLDPVLRAKYDLDVHGTELSPEERRERLGIIRRRTRDEVRNMQCSLDNTLRREHACDGLIILKALFGDLDAIRSQEFRVGSVVDITAPLQMQVHDSMLILPRRNKDWLSDWHGRLYDGIYDPCFGEEHVMKKIYIKYSFKGCKFEAEFHAQEEIILPRPDTHRMLDQDAGKAFYMKAQPTSKTLTHPVLVVVCAALFCSIPLMHLRLASRS